jgi:pimeloyl-ACP methyl ester carboxylesterase
VGLAFDEFGAGVPAVFVHGSFSWGLETWAEQRSLADAARILIVDRTGYGRTPAPATGELGWPVDGPALEALLETLGRAHVVALSYGAVVSLLTVSRRPLLVRSLTLIEPPILVDSARQPISAAIATRLRVLYDRAGEMTATTFYETYARSMGAPDERIAELVAEFDDAKWRAVEASRRERWPAEVPVEWDALASAPWPKTVVTGTAPALPGGELARQGYNETARAVAERIGADLVAFDGSRHVVQLDEPERFNRLLRETWFRA